MAQFPKKTKIAEILGIQEISAILFLRKLFFERERSQVARRTHRKEKQGFLFDLVFGAIFVFPTKKRAFIRQKTTVEQDKPKDMY